MAQYRVTLTQEEINELTRVSKLGKGPARLVLYARVNDKLKWLHY